MNVFNEFGALIMCDEGCQTICSECNAELHGEPSMAYIGSGEDAPYAYERSKHFAKKETITPV